MWVLFAACSTSATEPPPPARTRADAHEERLRAALSTPGVWRGRSGTVERTAAGTLKLAVQVCQYEDRDPTHADPERPSGCVPVERELPFLGVEGPFLVLQEQEPTMPLFAPAWLSGDGVLHLGPFRSNRVWAASVDDAGHADYAFTPAHHLTLDAGPTCAWTDQLGHQSGPIACATTDEGAVQRLRFTVPPGGFGPWEGDHGAIVVPGDGLLLDPEVECATFTRTVVDSAPR